MHGNDCHQTGRITAVTSRLCNHRVASRHRRKTTSRAAARLLRVCAGHWQACPVAAAWKWIRFADTLHPVMADDRDDQPALPFPRTVPSSLLTALRSPSTELARYVQYSENATI